jgi:hypothetical protein
MEIVKENELAGIEDINRIIEDNIAKHFYGNYRCYVAIADVGYQIIY